MTILVTGGAGYIGSHTCVELMDNGYNVIVIDNLCNSNPRCLDRVGLLTNKKVKFYEGDVRDQKLLEEIFSDNKIDCVIHFAGLKAVGDSVKNPWHYYDNNLNVTLVLTKVMKKYGVKNIIFSSSATVYDVNNPMPLGEESKTGNCTNPYGWTKYMTEQILKDMARVDSELGVVLLRYFNPIGAHHSGMIGEDPRGVPTNLMPYITQVAIGRRDFLSIYGDDYNTPDGTGVRDYIHVVDLAKGHVAAVHYLEQNKGCEAFNLGTGTGYSVLEMVNTFKKVNDVSIAFKIVERRDGDIGVCYSNPEKSNKKLSWKAIYSLEDMVRDSWKWQSQNPTGYSD